MVNFPQFTATGNDHVLEKNSSRGSRQDYSDEIVTDEADIGIDLRIESWHLIGLIFAGKPQERQKNYEILLIIQNCKLYKWYHFAISGSMLIA